MPSTSPLLIHPTLTQKKAKKYQKIDLTKKRPFTDLQLVAVPILEVPETQIKEAMMQYHQDTFMPNHTFLLEACKQVYTQGNLEHYYTNIQLDTIDAKQVPPHAVLPQEDQQVQIVPEVPPIAPSCPDEVQTHWPEALDSNLDKANQIIQALSRSEFDRSTTFRFSFDMFFDISTTKTPLRLLHVQSFLFVCPSHWPICSPHIVYFHCLWTFHIMSTDAPLLPDRHLPL